MPSAAYSARLQGVEIVNESFDTLLPKFGSADDLLYLDPPYPLSLRTVRGKRCYRYEMSDDDHGRLLDVALSSPAMVVLSGYEWNFADYTRNHLYCDRLSGWTKVVRPCRTAAGKWNNRTLNNDYREEVIWLNPLCRERLAACGSDLLSR